MNFGSLAQPLDGPTSSEESQDIEHSTQSEVMVGGKDASS